MKKIRVLLANHPMMIPDAIRQLLAEQEDMEVVGEVRGPMRTLQETGRVKADAVILAQEGTEEPALCSQLLAIYPDLIIITLTPDITQAFTQKRCAHRRSVTADKYMDVVQAVRMATKHLAWRKMHMMISAR